jgi:type I restriction enzyme S subunit
MSQMNFLEKLLDGAEVEWKPLGEITLPTNNIKWRETNDQYQYIDLTSVNIDTKVISNTIEITANNAPSRAQKIVKRKDVIFATTRPTQQRYCLIDEDYDGQVASTGYCILRAKQEMVLPKWILYWVSTFEFKNYLEENQSGSAYPAISDAKVKEFKIPLPCPNNPEKSLAIQAEIVRILDTFTELTAELTTRKKQYHYFRDQLLTFKEDEVEWKTLGELFKMRAGHHISANKIMDKVSNDHIYPCFGGNGIRGYVQAKSHNGEHLLIGRQGAYCGNVQRMKGEFYATEHAVVVTINDAVNLDWAFHLLTVMNLNQFASQSAQPGLAVGVLQNLKIPVPALKKQVHIASILDKFDTLTNSITEGLPREIALRQQQYEHYPNLLLHFPKN